MTWGADRRTAFEVERPFGSEAVGRLRGGGSSGRRMHPHFEVEDRRSRVWGGVERRLAFGVRAGAEAAWEEVVFGELTDRLTRVILVLEYDSLSGMFPRDDVKLHAAVERLSVAGRPAAVFRPRVDAQAFKGVGGQAVLAARVLYEGASAPLPPYERSLLGGLGTLRGWELRAGAEAAWEEVVFGELTDRLTRVILVLEYDSLSGMFPRDDVKLHAAVERLSVAGRPAAVFRPRVDAQAFKGVGGQAVLAARVLYEGASAPLPPYERSLLGGLGTLRGWEFGARVGDRLLAASIELRLPLSSPLATGKTGLRHGCGLERRIRARPVAEGCRSRRVCGPSGDRQRAVRRRPRSAGRGGGPQRGRLRLLKVRLG